MLQLFVDNTSSIVRRVWFVAVGAFDILVRDLSGTLTCEMLLCTFYAPRRVATIIFCVLILLAPRALWNITFDVRRLDFHRCVEEGCEYIYMSLFVVCGFISTKWKGSGIFAVRCLTFQTFVTS